MIAALFSAFYADRGAEKMDGVRTVFNFAEKCTILEKEIENTQIQTAILGKIYNTTVKMLIYYRGRA